MKCFITSSVFDLSVHKLLGRFTKLKLNLSENFLAFKSSELT